MVRASAMGLWAVLAGVASGCVVYRDRVITVSTRTRVELERDAQATATATTWPGDAPRRLESTSLGALMDYGAWRHYEAYGRVWVPDAQHVGADFVPYLSRGRWELTAQGWYWQSDDPWGRITFHYGRWVLIERTWAWVPGSTSPAWVDWRMGAGWVGWSPLPPVGATFAAPYVYCATRAFVGGGLAGRVVHGPAAASLYSRTRPLPAATGYGGSVYAWGPSPAAVGVEPAQARPVGQVWASGVRQGVPTAGEGGAVVGRPVEAPLAQRVGPAQDIPAVPAVAQWLNPATGTVRALDSVPGALREASEAPVVSAGPLRETVTLGSRVDVSDGYAGPTGSMLPGAVGPDPAYVGALPMAPRRVSWSSAVRPVEGPTMAPVPTWAGRDAPEASRVRIPADPTPGFARYDGPPTLPPSAAMPRMGGGMYPSTAGYVGPHAMTPPVRFSGPSGYQPMPSAVGAYPSGGGYGGGPTVAGAYGGLGMGGGGGGYGGGMMPSAQPVYAPPAYASPVTPSMAGQGAPRPAITAAPMGFQAPSAMTPAVMGPP